MKFSPSPRGTSGEGAGGRGARPVPDGSLSVKSSSPPPAREAGEGAGGRGPSAGARSSLQRHDLPFRNPPGNHFPPIRILLSAGHDRSGEPVLERVMDATLP